MDHKDGQLKATLKGPQAVIITLSINPEEIIIASRSEDCNVKLWNLLTRTIIKILIGHRNIVNAVSFPADWCLVVIDSENKSVNFGRFCKPYSR